MLGVRNHKANSNACCVSELLSTLVDLQMAWVTIHDSNYDNAMIVQHMSVIHRPYV